MKLQIRTKIVDDCDREIIFCSFPLDLAVGTVRDQIRQSGDFVYESLARNYLRSEREADDHR